MVLSQVNSDTEKPTIQILAAIEKALKHNNVTVVNKESNHERLAERLNIPTLVYRNSKNFQRTFLLYIYHKTQTKMAHFSKILSITQITHDVLLITVEKPATLTFKSGQAVDVSINKPGWDQELRPFTFTGLPDDDHLEFTIKIYPAHHGLTEQMLSLNKGDELILHDVFGDILYKGEGIFIAGGAGITPFIAIFKQLDLQNKIGNNQLIFANKTKKDIILENYFDKMLGENFINVLSAEKIDGYEHGYIDAMLIEKHISEKTKYFYLCGPEEMILATKNHLLSLGISDAFIIKEGY